MQCINSYRNRVAIDVLAKDITNARGIHDVVESHAMIGILSAQFSSVEEGALEIKRWMSDVPSISVRLGAGNPAQYYKAAMTAPQVYPAHTSRTSIGCGFAAGALAAMGGEWTHINALVSPTGALGDMLISIGVSSSQDTPARVSRDATVCMMLDSEARAAGLLPMGGEQSLPELYALAMTVVWNGMTLIEPTGGIDLDNFGVILQSCLEAGVPCVMPHAYSPIIDPQTGNTRPADVIRLMETIKALV